MLDDTSCFTPATSRADDSQQPKRQRGTWLRLLEQVLRLAGPDAVFIQHTEKAWSSAMFTGARHTVALSFEGTEAVAAGEALIAALPDHEFNVPGNLVADVVLVESSHAFSPMPRMLVEAEFLLLTEC